MASIDKFMSLASSKLYKPTKLQRKAVRSFLSKSDTFVCLPTGYGKSYIYQLSLLTAKQMSTNKSDCESSPVIVVVCPLNSLIADQIRSCEALGLSAVKLESSLEDTDKTDIVFVSPEKLDELETKKWLSNLGNRLVGVVVDESHCVVNWGSSEEGKPFREAYGRIGNLRGFTKAPILCLTATAGAKMRRMIIKSLMMKKVNIIHISPEKENIKIAIKSVKKQDLEETFSWLVEELKQLKNTTPKTIVYCGSLKVCGELYSIFDEHIESDTADRMFAMYHSKTPCEIQEKVLESLTTTDGKTRIVFATSALGMGVDIPNIERVIHFGIPKEMEDYVQEIGRCGRDGRKCVAVLYYKSYHLAHCETAMREYIKNTTDCRKKIIANYFKEENKPKKLLHECCDTCQKRCTCELENCKDNVDYWLSLVNYNSSGVHRIVDNNDKLLLKQVLTDMKEDAVNEITDELIDAIIKHCHTIFSIQYLMDNFQIYSTQTAKDVLALFNDIFSDISEGELLSSAEIDAYFDDDRLLMEVEMQSE